MNMQKTGRIILRILLYALYFLLGIRIGYQVAATLMQSRPQPLQTVPFALCLLLAFVLQKALHLAGHYCFGKLSGLHVVAFTLLHRTYVREKKALRRCAAFPESLLNACLMAAGNQEPVSYTAYLLGGIFFNLLASLAALIILLAAPWSLEEWAGCFCFAIFLVGIWFLLFCLLPLDRAGMPSDGLQIWRLKRKKQERAAFQQNLRLLVLLSEDQEIPSDLIEPAPYSKRDAGLYTAMLLLRQYEMQMWRAERLKAKEILLMLYELAPSLPEELQNRIWLECIFYLSLADQKERDQQLAQKLMHDSRIKRYEENATPESLRCLWVWALAAGQAEMAAIYEEAAKEAVNKIAFHPAVQGWKNVLTSCQTIQIKQDGRV